MLSNIQLANQLRRLARGQRSISRPLPHSVQRAARRRTGTDTKGTAALSIVPAVEAAPAGRKTTANFTFQDMQEWYVLFGKCGACGRTGHVDRWELARRFGRRTPIMSLRPRLVCTKCGNRRNNTFAAAPMKR